MFVCGKTVPSLSILRERFSYIRPRQTLRHNQLPKKPCCPHFFDLIDTVHRAVHGLSGEHFSPLVRIQSQTNHDHDEIIENIEVYECMIEDRSACME